MSRRGCRKARKAVMLRIWYVEQSLKQRPELVRPAPCRALNTAVVNARGATAGKGGAQ